MQKYVVLSLHLGYLNSLLRGHWLSFMIPRVHSKLDHMKLYVWKLHALIKFSNVNSHVDDQPDTDILTAIEQRGTIWYIDFLCKGECEVCRHDQMIGWSNEND